MRLTPGEFALDMHFRGQDDPRALSTQSQSFPAVVLQGSNPQLFMQMANFLPLRYVPPRPFLTHSFTADKGCVACLERQCDATVSTV